MANFSAIVKSFMNKNGGSGDLASVANAGAVTEAGPSIPVGQEFDQPEKTFGQQVKDFGVQIGRALASKTKSVAGGQSLGSTAAGDQFPGAPGGEAMFDPTVQQGVDFGQFARNLDNLVFRQAGGDVKKNQPAIVGEAGPELVIPKRDVTVVPKGPAAQEVPGESNILDSLLGGLKTGLIMATAQGREKHFAAQQRQTTQLLQAVEQFPELADVPEVQKRMNRFFGDKGETLGFIAAAASSKRGQSLGQQAGTLSPLIGGQDPAEMENALLAQVTGGAAAATPEQRAAARTQSEEAALRGLPKAAEAAGLGFSISPKTGITVRGAAPNKRDRDEAQVMAVFESLREAMGGDDVRAAQVAMTAGNRNRWLVPEPVRKLALSKTENEIAAARAGMEEFARATQGNRLEVQRAKEAEAAAGAKGKVIGEAAGQVDLLKNTVTINYPGLTPGAAPLPVNIPVGHLKGMTDPITDSAKLRGFMLPDGTLPQAGISPAQLMAAGAIPIDTQSEQLARRIGGIGDIVGDMELVAKKLFPTDDVTRRTQNASRYYWDWAVGGKIPEITLVSSLNARIGQLVAAMGGESANRLSDADVKRMAEGFGFGFFESKTTARTKIDVIRRGLEKLREGLLSGRLVPEITKNGGNPAEVARQLGIEREFETVQKRGPAPTRTGGEVTSPSPSPTTPPSAESEAGRFPGKGEKPLRGKAASEAVGGTLMGFAKELAAEVEKGTITLEQADKMMKAAEKAGMPPGEGLPKAGESMPVGGVGKAPAGAPGGKTRRVKVNGVDVDITE